MNDRILDIAFKLFHEDDQSKPGTYIQLNVEKFAKLLIQDCCDRIEHEYKYALGEKTQWAMSQEVQDLLKEHYGVDYDTGEP
jgi:hypothetical protein